MATVHVTTHSRLPPERVLAAGYDFSARRAEIFPAVSTNHLEIHELGNTSAEASEGTPAGIDINWRDSGGWCRGGSFLSRSQEKGYVLDRRRTSPTRAVGRGGSGR